MILIFKIDIYQKIIGLILKLICESLDNLKDPENFFKNFKNEFNIIIFIFLCNYLFFILILYINFNHFL